MFSSGGDYDVVVVGAGPGGYVAAIKAAQLGLKTACVESYPRLGGTCLNVGCIPSKALLESSHHYHVVNHDLGKHGIEVEGVKVDITKMMQNKTDVVTGLTGGIEFLFKKNKVDWIKGHGKIIGANEISIALNDGGNQSVRTKNTLIATGSVPAPLPPAPVDNAGKRIVDSTGILELESIPKKLIVIGGGVIGLEMASVWSRLGSEVTIVEFMDTICPGMDAELIRNFHKQLKKQGLKFQMKTKVVGTEVTDTGVKVTVEPSKGGDKTELEADVVLVATGRLPFTSGLGLEGLGIAMDKNGRITVDEHTFQTSIPSIRAIGDVIRGPMLAHKAEEEGMAAVEMIAGTGGHVNYDAIPGVIYTSPEVASVGKTEEQLKEAGIKYKKGVFNFQANSRARATLSTDGFVKILTEEATDRIVGCHIIGSNAGEMIMEGVIGIEYGASAEDLARTCHAHPTLSEAFKEACLDAFAKPIHS